MSDLARRWDDPRTDTGPLLRPVGDDHPVPYQVAIPVQTLLDAILGDEYLSLEDIASLLAQLAELTCDGADSRDRKAWTAETVINRVRELHETWNPPVECGGDPDFLLMEQPRR